MNKGNVKGLFPIAVFLVVFIGMGILFKDFYAMPTVFAFMIALGAAFLQRKDIPFQKKLKIAAEGMGHEDIFTMCLIFLLAGAFSGAISAAGGVESTVNLCLSFLPQNFTVIGLFLIGCFISVAMGTSMGTIAALVPIGVGIADKTGIFLPICIAAVVCGAMFGDNLSMISDTTIAAVKTQGCEMKDKFRANFWIVLPAAIITILCFYLLTKDISYQLDTQLTYNVICVLPYIFVLFAALLGVNVFLVLSGGTIFALIAGVITGNIEIMHLFEGITSGITGMYDITVISLLVACMVALVKEYGGIDYVLYQIRIRLKTRKQAELGIAALALCVDAATANNTVAILISGPLAKSISDEFHIPAKKTASLLDVFASVGQGLLPYGAQLLSASTLAALTPIDLFPFLFYPVLMAVSAILFIIFTKHK